MIRRTYNFSKPADLHTLLAALRNSKLHNVDVDLKEDGLAGRLVVDHLELLMQRDDHSLETVMLRKELDKVFFDLLTSEKMQEY